MNDFDDITSRLRRLGQEPVDPQVAARHLSAMAEVHPVVVVVPRRRFRPALAGGILAGALLGGTGLAGATGNLGPFQEPFHRVSAAVGVNVPRDGQDDDPVETAKDQAAEAVDKAEQARQQAREATQAAQDAGETAREAQEEAARLDIPTPPTADVPRFYGTPEAPCTVPVRDRAAAGPGGRRSPADARDAAGTRPKGPGEPPEPNVDDPKEPAREPFTTGNHTDYVLAHPPAQREEASRSDCGKPLSEVKPPPPGPPPPATPANSPGPKPPPPQGDPPAANPDGPPAGNAQGTPPAAGGG